MTKPVLPPDLADHVSPATILVRGGATRSLHDETCEALFMTSGFVYGDAGVLDKPRRQAPAPAAHQSFIIAGIARVEHRRHDWLLGCDL